MLVLIVAGLSFLAFYLTVLLMAFAAKLESRHVQSTRMSSSKKAHPLLSLTQAFDPIYAVLWEAPIAALRLLESYGRSGVPCARLRPIFDRAAACFPEIYEGHNFSQWLGVLEKNQFIEWNGGRVRLTPEGKIFLSKRFITDALIEAEEEEVEETASPESYVE